LDFQAPLFLQADQLPFMFRVTVSTSTGPAAVCTVALPPASTSISTSCSLASRHCEVDEGICR
jgi:hypothetical protein